MSAPEQVTRPPQIATASFVDAVAAVARLEEIYQRNTAFLRAQFERYIAGEPFAARVRATYPFIRITTASHARLDSRLAYGFVSRPGVHETTVTRPDLFRRYFIEQMRLLIANHGVPVEIGESGEPIPIHFSYLRDIGVAASFAPAPPERLLRDVFDSPDLAAMDDAIVNGTL